MVTRVSRGLEDFVGRRFVRHQEIHQVSSLVVHELWFGKLKLLLGGAVWDEPGLEGRNFPGTHSRSLFLATQGQWGAGVSSEIFKVKTAFVFSQQSVHSRPRGK